MDQIKVIINKTYAEIAEDLGCSIPVIRNQVKNIKKSNPERWGRSTTRNGKTVIVTDPDLVEEIGRRVRPGQRTAKNQVIALERQMQQLQQMQKLRKQSRLLKNLIMKK